MTTEDPDTPATADEDTEGMPAPAADVGAEAPGATDAPQLRLSYHAVSDVGRVRKDNQDSGYAGPWLLSVCDGVGGAARGDIASSTAIAELRTLDRAPLPQDVDLLTRVTDGLHHAHDSIANQVDNDPALSGTSTTATVALFDGRKIALGHVGDSRGYLFRDGELSQLTTDHTFVQTLIDEGRITEEEAMTHPHRNLILRALDGMHEVEPDVFALELVAGDRLFLCSDGACGVLPAGRIADILSGGSPEYAAIELVRASLEAGSSDNVTCVVADVLEVSTTTREDEPEPQIVGAAADLKKRMPRGLFRGHRSGDTGELPPVNAEIPEGVEFAIRADPPPPPILVDEETYRYAPRAPRRYPWTRRLLMLAVLLGLLWIGLAAAYSWTQDQYYLGEEDGRVTIYRGIPDLPFVSEPYKLSDVEVADLSDDDRATLEEGVAVDSLEEAEDRVDTLAEKAAD